MKLLVVGSGGREHALCWALKREQPAAACFCAPGNPGTAELATNLPVTADDLGGLVSAVEEHGVDLTVVGPEGPLAQGLADRLRARGRRVFGPSSAAAQIEASKAWAKGVMAAAGVPTAGSRCFGDVGQALAYVERQPEPLVVKASGLAAGKGAVVCATRAEARDAVRAMLGEGRFGEAGRLIVVEEFLEGEELSVLALTNGWDTVLLPAAQDHKRLLQGDAGPNTGGMGAYSPVALETPRLRAAVEQRILRPTLAELERRGAPFVGVLYAGLMVDREGNPSVVEFNCRFGDPEAQTILPRIAGGLFDALWAAASREPIPAPRMLPDAAVTTVLAAQGYPDRVEKGALIEVPADLPTGVVVFHAGTARGVDGQLRVSGGRVLSVTATAPTFRAAREASRAAAERVQFEGKQFRPDIGWREDARAA